MKIWKLVILKNIENLKLWKLVILKISKVEILKFWNFAKIYLKFEFFGILQNWFFFFENWKLVILKKKWKFGISEMVNFVNFVNLNFEKLKFWKISILKILKICKFEKCQFWKFRKFGNCNFEKFEYFEIL